MGASNNGGGGGGGFVFSPLPGGFAQATQGVTVVNSTPFGTGTSYGFNGTNGFISVNQGNDLAFGTGDFTIEWFQYQTALGLTPRIFSIGQYPTATIGVSIEGGTFYYWAPGANQSYSVSAGLISTWNHFAIVRIDNVTTIYRNGVALGYQSDNSNIGNTTTSLHIGQESPQSNAGAYFQGNITQFRWVKGHGVYTGNFTVPTGPLTYMALENQFGGTNTTEISVGLTRFILGPPACTSNALNTSLISDSIGIFDGGFSGTLNNVMYGWYANGPSVINAKVNYVNSGTEEIYIIDEQFVPNESYYFCSLPMPTEYLHNNNTNLSWPANQNGYSTYTGGFYGNDNGWTLTPISVPSTFTIGSHTSTNIYVGTNGIISVGFGADNSSISDGIIGGNPGNLWLQPGLSLSDGDTQNIYYLVEGDSLKWSLKLIIYCGHYGSTNTPYSYVLNIYKDTQHQWVETYIKSNTDSQDTGPYNTTDVTETASSTSKVWRGSLNGENWQYLGTGSVN
jgi:hypothetical protein